MRIFFIRSPLLIRYYIGIQNISGVETPTSFLAGSADALLDIGANIDSLFPLFLFVAGSDLYMVKGPRAV
jgi:hypothetical protein